jgi:hypothetical protein
VRRGRRGSAAYSFDAEVEADAIELAYIENKWLAGYESLIALEVEEIGSGPRS